MVVFPNAKINIGLKIISKRSDGYHNIETLFYPLMLHDALEFVVNTEKDGKDHMATSGLFIDSKPEDNLVLKAVSRLRKSYAFPFLRIHLHKAIPSGAGLGGGSSDAACTFKALNRLFSLNIPSIKLKEMALEIGSDCPFFIDNVPASGTGRGELLEPASIPIEGYYMVLLNPGLHVSTKEAYQNCRPSPSDNFLNQISALPLKEWKNFVFNDFEDFAIRKFPLIGQLKDDLYKTGALFSLMSGSGSSVFGLFNNEPVIPEKLRKFVIYKGLL
jgi:4-diphosphocytidyl-2-C-methyl-D-erythritol kinase